MRTRSSSTKSGRRNEDGLETQVVLEAQEVEEPMKRIYCHDCMDAIGFQDPPYGRGVDRSLFTLCLKCAPKHGYPNPSVS